MLWSLFLCLAFLVALHPAGFSFQEGVGLNSVTPRRRDVECSRCWAPEFLQPRKGLERKLSDNRMAWPGYS